jgi:hypothetical protein
MTSRLQAALVAMLTGLAALAIATAAMHRSPGHNAPVQPASDLGQLQTVDSGTPAVPQLGETAVTNTVDPPAAHDSDMPTGAPGTTTPPKPATPAPAAEPEHQLTTYTDNGTAVAPKPETQAPPPPTVNTHACSQPENCQP